MSIELTKVIKVNPVKDNGAVIGFVDCEFNGVMTVRGMKVVEGKFGRFVGHPNKMKKGGGEDGKNSYQDIFYFTDQDLKKKIHDEILEAFKQHESNSSPQEDI